MWAIEKHSPKAGFPLETAIFDAIIPGVRRSFPDWWVVARAPFSYVGSVGGWPGRGTMRDLNALGLFAMVVEAKSFSAAARRLSMPVSTVSRRIAELEDQLGVRLLERSTRNLRLTEVGAEVLQHARHSAELCEAVDNIVSNSAAEVSGTLRLCTPPSISDSLIIPVVSGFQSSYPAVRVQVRITERIVRHMSEDVDIAFMVGPFTDPSLVARTLLTYRHQVVASPTYLVDYELPKCPVISSGIAFSPFLFGSAITAGALFMPADRNERRWRLSLVWR